MLLGVGVFFHDQFFSQKVLYGIHSNTWKYNVCIIKLETKLLFLHKISV